MLVDWINQYIDRQLSLQRLLDRTGMSQSVIWKGVDMLRTPSLARRLDARRLRRTRQRPPFKYGPFNPYPERAVPTKQHMQRLARKITRAHRK